MVLNTRGFFAFRDGRYEQALTDFKEALGKIRLIYGENAEYAAGCGNCAEVCRKLGREQEAETWEKKKQSVEQTIAAGQGK